MKNARCPGALNVLLDAVFPGRCLVCGQWLSGGEGLPVCAGCRETLTPLSGSRCAVCSMPLISERETCVRCRETSFSFRHSFSLFPFDGVIRDLIHQYKFYDRWRLSGLFAGLLAREAEDRLRGAVIVPVPPRPGSGRDRVGLIAARLHFRHGAAVRSVLERARGAPQKSLDFAQRQRNLQGAFTVKRGMTAPLHAVLLDDVFTTGATLDACARALLEGGAERVTALTVAIDM